MSLETAIDELYQLPLAAFTAARNALAKSLRGAEAQRVRHLEKPAVVPWAINQVYWRARAAYDTLLKSGEALRDAQVSALTGKSPGKPGNIDVRHAVESHRAAVSEAVRHATRLAEASGARPAPEPLARMLEALSIAPKHPERPGRLTQLVQPAGFEALAGVTPIAFTPKPRATEPKRDASPARAAPAIISEPPGKRREAEKRARAEALRQAREAAALQRVQAAARKRAEAALARAEQAEAAARRDVERAQEELRSAEKQVAEARASLRETVRASE